MSSDPVIPVAFYPLWVKVCKPLSSLLFLWGAWGYSDTNRWTYFSMALMSLAVWLACTRFKFLYRAACRVEAVERGIDPNKVEFR